MLFSKIAVSLQAFAAIPLLVTGAVLPADAAMDAVEKRADCLVNARQRDLWVENGLSRWRTVFSAEGTDPANFCHYWFDEFWTNLQCGYSKEIDGGTWFVDVSIARGAGGDGWYWTQLGLNRDQWIKDTGCRTG